MGPRDGVSALTLGFLAGTRLCVIRLESFTGKSFFKESRNNDRSEEGNDKTIIQPSLKEQHLHHQQEETGQSLTSTTRDFSWTKRTSKEGNWPFTFVL